jgi:hypothetical protein
MAAEDLRFIGVWLSDERNQEQGPEDHELDINRRGFVCRTFQLSGMMAGRLLNQLSEPANKSRFKLAKSLLRDGWSEADILARPDFDTSAQTQAAAADPASAIKAQREALALDVLAGRLTHEEWARRYQGIALAEATLSGMDMKTTLSLLDRTLFANPASTAPRLSTATAEATAAEAELETFLNADGGADE